MASRSLSSGSSRMILENSSIISTLVSFPFDLMFLSKSLSSDLNFVVRDVNVLASLVQHSLEMTDPFEVLDPLDDAFVRQLEVLGDVFDLHDFPELINLP